MISIRTTIPIRGIVHDGSVPASTGEAVVAAAAGAWVGCTVVTAGRAVAATVGIAVTKGDVTEMKPGTTVVLRPPELTAVRLTE